MDISRKISQRCIKFIRKNSNKGEEDLEKIQYGIEVILINIIKLFILFITAYFLKVFFYTFVAFISFAILRSFASGVHANSSIKCILINYIIFFSNVYLSIKFTFSKPVIVSVYLISLILVVLYAPADTEKRPIVSRKQRKSLKIKSVICVSVFAIVSLILPIPIYMNLITFSVLEESLMITPMIYIIFRKSYKNYEKIEL